MHIRGNRDYSCNLKFKEQSFLDRNPRQVWSRSLMGVLTLLFVLTKKLTFNIYYICIGSRVRQRRYRWKSSDIVWEVGRQHVLHKWPWEHKFKELWWHFIVEKQWTPTESDSIQLDFICDHFEWADTRAQGIDTHDMCWKNQSFSIYEHLPLPYTYTLLCVSLIVLYSFVWSWIFDHGLRSCSLPRILDSDRINDIWKMASMIKPMQRSYG